MKVLLYWYLTLILLPCFLEESQALDFRFQTLDMSPYHSSSASVCNRASTTGFKNRAASTLEVVNRHGPCAQTDKSRPVDLPSFAKILANDQLRVKSIQSRVIKSVDLINTNKDPNKSCRDERAKLPARSGVPLDEYNYILTIGLGTPEQKLTLVFDTGSDLTWTQCQPCGRGCYQQKDTIFNPRYSSSYSNISCNDKKCSQLNTTGANDKYCSSGTCFYMVGYGDGSRSIGLFAKEKLTVTPTNVFHNFILGCGHNNTGLFGETDGLLGLGRDPLSFVSQTAKRFGQYFSYCLPSTRNSLGFIAFGKNNEVVKKDDATMVFTPLVPSPPGYAPNFYYFIEITAISVGGKQLGINRSVFTTAGAVIDSGTVISRLPPVAYSKMSREFKRQMKKLNYKSAPEFEDALDTCYYISRHTNTTNVPTVSFTFKGNATINLDTSGILYVFNSTYACLAFIGNSDPSDLAIFGNAQQMKFEVAYDVAGGKLGFAHNPYCH